MIKITTFTRKQPNKSNDYTKAYDIINNLSVGSSDTATPDNIKVFRKYVYDLGLKHNKSFATRLYNGSLTITRLP